VFDKSEEKLLTELAKKVAFLAEDPINEEKRRFWHRHNELKGERPAVFVHPDGAWAELLPSESLVTNHYLARHFERILRQRIIRHEYLPDDVPIERTLRVEKVWSNSWWGVSPKFSAKETSGGSWHHIPIIEKPDDWKSLKTPVVEYNDAATKARWEYINGLLGDILDLELAGNVYYNFHLMHWYCDYRGLENMFMDLILEPDMVKEAINFFAEGTISMFKQMEALGLISLNNNDAFHYTGGIGYTNSLPAEGFDKNHVRLKDVWGAAEAQEFDSVSPEMHEEFVLKYERKVLDLFGLNGYGCCDNLGKKLDGVPKIKNLRRVAVCPWADIDDFLPVLKDKYIMTWKPQPAYLAQEKENVEAIENELNTGIKKANGGRLELILRDTHTVKNEPERFTKWIEIARNAIEKSWMG